MIASRRFVIGGFGLLCLSYLGCMQIPFCIPEINTVAPVDFGDDSTNVHIFRVDVVQHIQVDSGTADVGHPPKASERLELTEIQAASQGTTPRQTAVSWEHGWRYVGFWNYNSDCLSHGVVLRLYRRGYETISLPCGQSPGDVQWTAAAELSDQEKAIDDLLGVAIDDPSETPIGNFSIKRILERGTVSATHRKALLFAAHEYEYLARGLSAHGPDDQTDRSRLLQKADRLKALADGKRKAE